MKCITVPISNDAMARLDLDECITGDVIELSLNEKDYDELWKTGIFYEINNALNINIDDYEDETLLGVDNLLIAKKIIEEKINIINNKIVSDGLLSQINTAIECKTGLFFYF